jgi:hypothetical protein
MGIPSAAGQAFHPGIHTLCSSGNEEEATRMIEKVHGMDRHKRFDSRSAE